MKKLAFILAGITVFIFTFSSFSFAGQLVNERRHGRILFKMNDAAPEHLKARARVVLSAYGARNERFVGSQASRLERLSNLRNKAEEQICRELKVTGGVEFAEPDFLVPPERIPNDPQFAAQWHHTVMNSPATWDKTTGDQRVIVAVCDSGIESNHPDLAGNLMLPGFNTVDSTTNTTPVMFHGTAVAGCIGAIGNNAAGIAGMAWNIKIMPLRVSNTSDGYAYFSDIAEAIYYAADHGAKVINISYGVGNSAAIDSASKYARSRGALVFASAGNSGVEVAYPDYTSFILVGATNSADAKTSWSNYGTALDIVAPGESIMTTSTGLSYGAASGTSFSSPLAAGVAALVFSVNPNFTPDETENLIYSSCKDLGTAGRDKTFGRGRVDANAAVDAAIRYRGNTPPVALMKVSQEIADAPATITFDGSLSYDSDGTITSYAWNFGDNTTGSGVTASHVYPAAGTFTAVLTVKDTMSEPSAAQKTLTINPDHTIITAPSNLNATVQRRAVVLKWKDNSSNEEGFFIERKIQTRTALFARTAETQANATSYMEVFAGPGAYTYRIQAFNKTTGKVSGYSKEVNARIIQ